MNAAIGLIDCPACDFAEAEVRESKAAAICRGKQQGLALDVAQALGFNEAAAIC